MLYNYYGLNQAPSHCDVRIWKKNDKEYVILFTELDTNTGTSVTNFSEQLAQMINNQFLSNVSQKNITFFEHYEGRDNVDQINYRNGYNDPYWKYMTMNDFKELVKHSEAMIY